VTAAERDKIATIARERAGGLDLCLGVSGNNTQEVVGTVRELERLVSCMTAGPTGGILASAHLGTRAFVEVARAAQDNDLDAARTAWATIAPIVPLLFAEPSPMPVKHCLWRRGLIASPECRLPLTRVSERHARALDEALGSILALA